MADLIDRDAVLHDVSTECSNAHEAKYYEAQVALTRAKRIICDAPAVNRWILCSERLPEENKVVLVSTTTGYVDFAVLRWGKWFPDGYNGVAFPPNRITAWMPKPDAYVPPKGEQK